MQGPDSQQPFCGPSSLKMRALECCDSERRFKPNANASVFRERKLNTNFFSQTFRASPGYPGKIPGYPVKKFGFPGFEGHTELFGPHPFTWKTPPPNRKYYGPKSLGLGSFFLPEF